MRQVQPLAVTIIIGVPLSSALSTMISSLLNSLMLIAESIDPILLSEIDDNTINSVVEGQLARTQFG